jgi:hypothetical protein
MLTSKVWLDQSTSLQDNVDLFEARSDQSQGLLSGLFASTPLVLHLRLLAQLQEPFAKQQEQLKMQLVLPPVQLLR